MAGSAGSTSSRCMPGGAMTSSFTEASEPTSAWRTAGVRCTAVGESSTRSGRGPLAALISKVWSPSARLAVVWTPAPQRASRSGALPSRGGQDRSRTPAARPSPACRGTAAPHTSEPAAQSGRCCPAARRCAHRWCHPCAHRVAGRSPVPARCRQRREGGRVPLGEGLKQRGEKLGRDAGTAVFDFPAQHQVVRRRLRRDPHLDTAVIGELDGIPDQVDQHLSDASGVAVHPEWDSGVDARYRGQPPGVRSG